MILQIHLGAAARQTACATKGTPVMVFRIATSAIGAWPVRAKPTTMEIPGTMAVVHDAPINHIRRRGAYLDGTVFVKLDITDRRNLTSDPIPTRTRAPPVQPIPCLLKAALASTTAGALQVRAPGTRAA